MSLPIYVMPESASKIEDPMLVICPMLVIHTIVGYRMNYAEGHELMKGICPSF